MAWRAAQLPACRRARVRVCAAQQGDLANRAAARYIPPTSARADPDPCPATPLQLFSVKEKQKKEAEAAKEGVKKQTAGELRVQKDMTELNLSSTTSIAFPKGPDHLLDFEVTLMVRERDSGRPGRRGAAWRGAAPGKRRSTCPRALLRACAPRAADAHASPPPSRTRATMRGGSSSSPSQLRQSTHTRHPRSSA